MQGREVKQPYSSNQTNFSALLRMILSWRFTNSFIILKEEFETLLIWNEQPGYTSLSSSSLVSWSAVIMAQAVQKIIAKVPSLVGGTFNHCHCFLIWNWTLRINNLTIFSALLHFVSIYGASAWPLVAKFMHYSRITTAGSLVTSCDFFFR